MKVLKLKTGLKGGQCGEDLLKQYCATCGAGNQSASSSPSSAPAPSGGGGADIGQQFRQAGMEEGRRWRNFGMSFIP